MNFLKTRQHHLLAQDNIFLAFSENFSRKNEIHKSVPLDCSSEPLALD